MNNVVTSRVIDLLRDSLGPCGALLEDPQVVELMVNDDGRVWVERAGNSKCVLTEYALPVQQRLNVIRVLAGRMELVCNATMPRLSTILPETGERFQGFVPPVVPTPAFAIRRPAIRLFTLEEYVQHEILTASQYARIMQGIAGHENLLIAGGTSSGKTTLANAVLHQMAQTGDRIITVEDTPELQCTAPNHLALYTTDGVQSMHQCVKDLLRCRPDRVIIGEVRGEECADFLESLSTGHPGGLCTVHANNARGTLGRLASLVRRANIPQDVARELIAAVEPLIVYIERTSTGRVVKEVLKISGLVQGEYTFDN